jgi:hypothetical protein
MQYLRSFSGVGGADTAVATWAKMAARRKLYVAMIR